jgi:hypothetical protein
VKIWCTVDSRNSGSQFSGLYFGPKELKMLIFTLDLAAFIFGPKELKILFLLSNLVASIFGPKELKILILLSI